MSPPWPSPEAVRAEKERAEKERELARRREVYKRHPRDDYAKRVAEQESNRKNRTR